MEKETNEEFKHQVEELKKQNCILSVLLLTTSVFLIIMSIVPLIIK